MFRAEIFVLCVTLAGTYSQIIGIGPCPEMEVVKNFDVSAYMGKWYEIKRYPLIFELFGKCVTAEYSANADHTVRVHNEQINYITHLKETITGSATVDNSTTGEAKLTVMFPGFLGSQMSGAYWVAGSDYKHYSVVWSCTQIGALHFKSSWILARARKPSTEVLNAANKVITEHNITMSHYSLTDQDNCPENH